MGTFTYEHTRVDFDDRLLAHLQHVIYNKLRRGESMAFTWTNEGGEDNARTSVWLHPAATLVFEISGVKSFELNREWLDQLAIAANAPAGLHTVPEPASESTRH